MKTPLRILYLEDNENDALLVQGMLEQEDFECRIDRVETRSDFTAALENNTYDLIFSDFSLPAYDGGSALKLVTEKRIETPYIFVSGKIGEGPAIDSLLHGATDYVLKQNLSRLIPAVRRALRETETRKKNKKMEQDLRDSEIRYRRLFEAAKDGILILDAETGTVADANPFIVKLLGYSRELFIGKQIWELGFLKDIVTNQENFIELQRKGHVRYEDLPLQTRDGRRIDVEFVSNLYQEDHQKVVQCNIRDISERKKSEKAQVLLTTALESTANGVVITDVKGDIVWVNKAFTEMTGYGWTELVGHNPSIVKSGKQADSFYKKLWQTISHGNIWHGELTNKKKDGSLYVEEMTITPLKTAGGEITNFIAIKQDITQRKEAEDLIKSSEERLKILFEYAPDGIFLMDLLGTFTDGNRTSEEIIGYKREELIGKNLFSLDLISKADVLKATALLAKNAMGMAYGPVEFVLRRRNNSRIPVEIRSYPVTIAGKKQVLGVARDITERKRAVEALTHEHEMLREGQKKFKELYDEAPVGYHELDKNGCISKVNATELSLLGYTYDEMIGRPAWEFSQDREGARESVQAKLLGQKDPSSSEARRVLKKDGTTLSVLLQERIIRGIDGSIVGIRTTFQDITELMRAEEEVKRSQEWFEAVFDASRDGIVVEEDENIVYVNRAFLGLCRYESANELTGKPISIIYDEADQERLVEYSRMRRRGESTPSLYEFKAKRKDGTVFPAEFSVSSTEIAEQHYMIAILRDISTRKELEAQFLRVQRLESIGTLAGGIAHDLNNVLGPILLSLQVMRGKIEDPVMRKMIDMIESSANRGADLIKQVLSFAKGAPGERVAVQIKYIVREIESIVRDTFPKSISLVVDLPKNLQTIKGDATQLHQVLMNLCVNARDAMPEGGTLAIAAKNEVLDQQYVGMHLEAEPGNYVVVSVSDTGTGMSPEVKERIFEPFYSTKEVGKGTGLGLPTVLSIVKGHGGFINVYSESRRGTTFRIYFPTGEQGEVRKQAESREEIRGKGELILVVDDEEAVREITKTTLEVSGYSVVAASDGADAVSKFVARRNEFALVITDMMMPYMDGTATIRALKKIDPNIRILLVSGLEQDISIAKANKLVRFLRKPYTSPTLLQSMNDLLTSDR